MNQNTALTLTSNSAGIDISDAEKLAALRLDRSLPRYAELKREQRLAFLRSEIFRLNTMKHQDIPAEQIALDADFLDNFMMDDHFIKDYTMAEIRDAFKCGVKGEYGEYYGITSDSLYKFLSSYFMGSKKREATKIVRAVLGGGVKDQKGQFYIEKCEYHKAEILAKKMRGEI